MGTPIVDPADLAILLNDDSLDTDRAAHIIGRAQTLCEMVVNPLPDGAEVVVERVAARGYVTITAARQVQLGMADSMFGTQSGPVGGIYLTRFDRADLLSLSTSAAGAGGRAFTINMLPTGYTATDALPPWDVNGGVGVATS